MFVIFRQLYKPDEMNLNGSLALTLTYATQTRVGRLIVL